MTRYEAVFSIDQGRGTRKNVRVTLTEHATIESAKAEAERVSRDMGWPCDPASVAERSE